MKKAIALASALFLFTAISLSAGPGCDHCKKAKEKAAAEKAAKAAAEKEAKAGKKKAASKS